MIKNISKTEQLKNMLLEDIRNGTYRPGDPLPSIRDLVARYEVSKHTVTQALSNLHELNIIEIAHGKPTRLRGNPFKRQIELIYVGQGDVATQTFWREIYQGIADAIRENPLFSIRQSSFRATYQGALSTILDPAQSCGALLLGISNPEAYEELKKFGIPLISVHDFNLDSQVPYVTSDFTATARESAEKFRQSGCRKVALFHFSRKSSKGFYGQQGVDKIKFETFRNALIEAGVTSSEFITQEADDNRNAYCQLKELVRSGRKPDGIVLTSDTMALGVYRAAYELGIRIPTECPVLGIDDLEDDSFMIPSLSSIDLHRKELGYRACQMLINFNEKHIPMTNILLPAELKMRESF